MAGSSCSSPRVSTADRVLLTSTCVVGPKLGAPHRIDQEIARRSEKPAGLEDRCWDAAPMIRDRSHYQRAVASSSALIRMSATGYLHQNRKVPRMARLGGFASASLLAVVGAAIVFGRRPKTIAAPT